VPADFALGRAIRLRDGRDLTIIATGTVVRPALDAADTLMAEGLSARVVDMHTVKPLDVEEVLAAARETGGILAVEEHSIVGGLGSAVAEVLVGEPRIRFRRHGVPDEFAPIGPPAALYAHYRLDAAGIASVARELLN
jgi:transketolase